MFHCWMKTIPLRIQNSIFSSKGLLHENDQVLLFLYIFVHKFEDLQQHTLKLSAVFLAPAGTVYRLLGNQRSRHEKQFDGYKPYHTSGSYSQAFGSKYLTTSFSAKWVTGWNPLWRKTSKFLLDAASWTSSECRIDLFLHLFLPMGFTRNFSRRKLPA